MKVVQSCLTLCGPRDCRQQAPLSMRFPKQECWSGFPCPPPGHLPGPGIELHLLHHLHWQADSSLLGPPESGEKLTASPLGSGMRQRCLLLPLYFNTVLDIPGEDNGTHSSTLAWKIPWTEEPGRLQGPWGCKESDMAERLHFHFSLSCVRERNGNPLQCSCLENPRDSGASWAAVYGVAQSWTRLK